jgi:hypothetical protein
MVVVAAAITTGVTTVGLTILLQADYLYVPLAQSAENEILMVKCVCVCHL